MGLLQLRYEYDSNTIRLQHATGAATWKLLVCRVPQGNAEIAGLDIDGRMYEQLTELKWQNFIP